MDQRPSARRRRMTGPAAVCALYLALHVASDLAARRLTIGSEIHIRTAPGLALAFLLLCGPGFWPVVLAAFLLSSFAILAPAPAFWAQLSLPLLLTAGCAGAAWLIRRRLGPSSVPRRYRDGRLAAGAALGAALPWASVGTAILLGERGILTAHNLLYGCAVRWLDGTASILTLVPAAVVLLAPRLSGETPPPSRRLRPAPAAAIFAGAVALTAAFWVLRRLSPATGLHIYSLAFIPLVWAAIRYGLPGSVWFMFAFNGAAFVSFHPSGDARLVVVDFLLFSIVFALIAVGFGMALTLQAEAAEEAAGMRERLGLVLSGARLGLWDYDLGTGRSHYDRAWAEMIGYDLSEVPQEASWWEAQIHPHDRRRVTEEFAAHVAGRIPFYETDYRLRAKDGTWRWIRSRGSVVARREDGRPARIAGTHLDLTSERRADAEKARLHHIIDASPDFIGTVDLDRRYVYLNPAFQRLVRLGEAGEVRTLTVSDTHPEWARRKIVEEALPAVLERGSWLGESALRDAHGREVPVSQLIILQRDEEGRPAFFSTIARDISRQRELEEVRLATERKLLQAQKLESLGVLAGGVAHDFNNLLTAILGNASLAELELPPGSAAPGYLQRIRSSAIRAAELCKQMLAYSGRGQIAAARVDLSALIEETASLLQVSVSKKAVLKLDLARGLPTLHVDPVQVRQIVMNLVMNASDAIGERSGVIRIATGLLRADASCLAGAYLSPSLDPGDYVFMEVADTGCGMTPEVQARIFEPFYTTKFTGRGLGLAAVLGIVNRHRGAIKVSSEAGRGSAFKVLLPAFEPKEGAAGGPAAPAVRPGRASGTVLVVDDEETVRTVAARILESVGFDTVLAADGKEAVRIFGGRAADFSAVLLDLTMPHMNGEETFRELQRIKPDVRVVLMSGFSEEDSTDRFSGLGLAGFVPKPFDQRTLVRKLLEVAGGPVPPA